MARIRDLFGSVDDRSGIDFAFDCVGAVTTIEQCPASVRSPLSAVRRGDTVVLVGVPLASTSLDTVDMLTNEKQITGSVGGSCIPDRDFPIFAEWYGRGALDPCFLVTTRYRLGEIEQAAADLAAPQMLGRAIVTFDGDA